LRGRVLPEHRPAPVRAARTAPAGPRSGVNGDFSARAPAGPRPGVSRALSARASAGPLDGPRVNGPLSVRASAGPLGSRQRFRGSPAGRQPVPGTASAGSLRRARRRAPSARVSGSPARAPGLLRQRVLPARASTGPGPRLSADRVSCSPARRQRIPSARAAAGSPARRERGFSARRQWAFSAGVSWPLRLPLTGEPARQRAPFARISGSPVPQPGTSQSPARRQLVSGARVSGFLRLASAAPGLPVPGSRVSGSSRPGRQLLPVRAGRRPRQLVPSARVSAGPRHASAGSLSSRVSGSPAPAPGSCVSKSSRTGRQPVRADRVSWALQLASAAPRLSRQRAPSARAHTSPGPGQLVPGPASARGT
jgi:hypothetical protein